MLHPSCHLQLNRVPMLNRTLRSIVPKPPIRHKPESLVRHEKGALLQWEEDIPSGNCCSSRKQPKRSLLVTAVVEASGLKRSRKGKASTQVET
jgi:hypothetical protein